MTYDEWTGLVPSEITEDPLWRMEVYRLSLFAADLTWRDVTKLIQDKRTIGLSDQLYRSAGAVSSDIAEGYSRRSGKDQARFYEYALGSAREARNWHYQSRHILNEKVIAHRLRLWTHIIRLLLKIIPAERGYKLEEDVTDYRIFVNDTNDLLNRIPLPDQLQTRTRNTQHATRIR
jgi:four helix bundle protein